MNDISYVPIMKWKQGEYTALSKLFPKDKASLTPLVEIVPIPTVWDEERSPISIEHHVAKIPKQVEEHWGADDPIWIDSWLLQENPLFSDGQHVLDWLMCNLRDRNIKAIPVVWKNYDQSTIQVIKDAVDKDGRGVCIRLDESDADDPNILNIINNILDVLELTPENVDFLLDVGSIRSSEVDRTIITCRHLLSNLPHISRWRMLILASSGFPENMSGIEAGISTLQRSDWLLWERLSQEFGEGRIDRLPIFSDYAIAHPEIVDLDPRTMQMSANIRYTSVDSWIIFKGRGVKRYGYEQIYGLCRQLVNHSCYRGKGFSFGDEVYFNRANESDSVGNASQWRRDATNHHITFVVRQLSQLHQQREPDYGE